jgi:hypothetical protein
MIVRGASSIAEIASVGLGDGLPLGQSGHDVDADVTVARDCSRTLWVAPSPAYDVNDAVDARPLRVNAWSGHARAAAPLAQTRRRGYGRESPASPESAGEP